MVDGLQLGPETAESVRLAVSELVSNAVMHGIGAIAVALALEGEEVRVAVRDDGTGFAPGRRAAMPPPDAPGGRGLALVAVLSSRWGVLPGDPTEVWCVITPRG